MKAVTAEELRRMSEAEGLVLQGCGGDLQEWIDGINGLLKEANILIGDSRFRPEDVLTFQQDGHRNLLFLFRQVKLNMGRLAIWRLQTYGQFGGMWLSDYVPNRLGGYQNNGKEAPSL